MAARILAGLVCTALAAGAFAQTPNQIPVYRLDLRKVPDIPEGDAALVAGNAGATPHRFFVENLYMLKPVSVTVRAVEPGGVVNVKLTKEKWEEVLREATTGQDSQVNFKFRTQGQFQISITSPTPDTAYKMVVWVGTDIVPKRKAVFVPPSDLEGKGASRSWMWLSGGAVIIIAAIALLMRRRKQA
jgi:hypothetical protein